jgi:hypothetical protein
MIGGGGVGSKEDDWTKDVPPQIDAEVDGA